MKTWMRIITGCLAVVALAGLAGCGGGDGDDSGGGGDPALVGQWRMIAMSVNGSRFFAPGQIGWDVQLQLNADGSATATEVWRGEHDSGGGSWSTAGNQLKLNVGDYHWTGPYTVSGSQFTLSNVPDYDRQGHTGAFVFQRF